MNIFVTGTDTDVGKTIASAWIMLHLNADYWKPVQCGFEPITDSQYITQLTDFPLNRIHPTVYELKDPLSPHEAAKRSRVSIELSKFQLPETKTKLVVEGAGGVLVPLNKQEYIIDLIRHLSIPVILVCRSTLGTINHTLLSIEAIKSRNIALAGVILIGPLSSHNREAIETYGNIKVFGEIPILSSLNKETLLSIKPTSEFLDFFSM